MKKLLLVLLVTLGLQTQAQITPCDSVSYTILSGSGGNTTLQLNGILAPGFPGIVLMWDWQVCDDALCFGDTGQVAYFQQFNTSDTLKVCLTTIIDYMNTTYSCMLQCDSLVYGPNGWMMMNMGNPTGIGFVIEEDGVRWYNDKIYDLQGRKLNEIPVGKMYIRYGKLHIKY
tara:strand:- start:219 stop:734 length:516 start_codon:yes stop_codon:yes gene_type:complete